MILLTLLFSLQLEAKQIRVAVIDTGINFKNEVTLCDTGHKDFTGTGLVDNHGHGKNISHIIERYAEGVDYCQIIIKFYNVSDARIAGPHLVKAINFAIEQKVDIINISGGGLFKNTDEEQAIKNALNKGIKIVTAAGNDNMNLDKMCIYYPACYDKRLTVIGNTRQSNYGKIVDIIEDGNKVEGGGIWLTGSSQSTAIATGKLIHEISKKNNRRNIKK